MGATALGVSFDDDSDALEMPVVVADDARIDDDMDLESVLDDATVDAALDPAPEAPAESPADEPAEEPKFDPDEIVLDDLSIDGLEVDET